MDIKNIITTWNTLYTFYKLDSCRHETAHLTDPIIDFFHFSLHTVYYVLNN